MMPLGALLMTLELCCVTCHFRSSFMILTGHTFTSSFMSHKLHFNCNVYNTKWLSLQQNFVSVCLHNCHTFNSIDGAILLVNFCKRLQKQISHSNIFYGVGRVEISHRMSNDKTAQNGEITQESLLDIVSGRQSLSRLSSHISGYEFYQVRCFKDNTLNIRYQNDICKMKNIFSFN